MHLHRLILLLLAFVTTVAPVGAAPRPDRSLLLVLVIDQGRYDYFERFRAELQGGFAYLRKRGVWFTDAHHGHTPTTTAPGHATIISGVYPHRTGIVDNQWYDRTLSKTISTVYDPEFGHSPLQLRVDVLPDWLKRVSPSSQVFAVSGKDRGAILLGGRRANGAYWYNKERGIFISSKYYGSTPSWLDSFNKLNSAERLFGTLWEPLPLAERSPALLGILPLDTGVPRDGFPRIFGSPSPRPNSSFYSDLARSPFLDGLTLDVARELIAATSLGQGAQLDYLAISLSAVDGVGHAYGPESLEVFDTLRRTDRSLGEFFKFLDQKIGLQKITIVVSSDHGAIPLPEAPTQQRMGALRFGAHETQCIQQSYRAVTQRFGTGELFLGDSYLDYEKINRLEHSPADVAQTLANAIRRCPTVARVVTRQEILDTSATQDAFLLPYRRGFDPERSPDFFIVPKLNVLPISGRGTTHFTPYRYDTHVPLVIADADLNPREINEPVSVVATAPTVANLLGIPFPPNLEGATLSLINISP